MDSGNTGQLSGDYRVTQHALMEQEVANKQIDYDWDGRTVFMEKIFVKIYLNLEFRNNELKFGDFAKN